jgi:ribosomal protein L12E/L44/L45/RPP1/RPP2
MGAMKEGVMGFSKGLLVRGVRGRVLWLALAGMLVSPNLIWAQAGQTVTVDQATMQALLKRIDQLEARVQQLEAAQHPAVSEPANAGARQQPSADASTHGPSQAAAQEHEPEPSEHAESERMDVSKTLLRIRGFGDVTFHAARQLLPSVSSTSL